LAGKKATGKHPGEEFDTKMLGKNIEHTLVNLSNKKSGDISLRIDPGGVWLGCVGPQKYTRSFFYRVDCLKILENTILISFQEWSRQRIISRGGNE
jgi:hypothetical protein